MKEKQLSKRWARIFGDDYLYQKYERIRLIKSFVRSQGRGKISKGFVFNVVEDLGDRIQVEVDYPKYEIIPKKIIEPFPFLNFKVGERIRVKVTIHCTGSCTHHHNRSAYCSIRRGRTGIITKIQDYGTYHRLLSISFRGEDKGVYEDWEVKKIE